MINRSNIYPFTRALMEGVCMATNVNPPHPAYPDSYVPLFSFQWGERPSTCERGAPIVYAWLSGERQAAETNCSHVRELDFTVGAVLAGPSESERYAWEDFFCALKSGLGQESDRASFCGTFGLPRRYAPGGTPAEGIGYDAINSTFIIGSPFSNADQIAFGPEFFLSHFGVARSRCVGESGFRREGGECPLLYRETLVRWTIYLASATPRRYWHNRG